MLAEPAYRDLAASTDVAPRRTLLELVWDWLVRYVIDPLLGPLSRAFAAGRHVGTVAGIALVVVALLAVCFVVVRLALAFGRRGVRARATQTPGEPAFAAMDWRARASEAAARGDYARAIAALWAAALVILDERGLVTLDPARTPGEYRRLVRNVRAAAAAPFDLLGERFVYATYASGITSASDYERAERAYASFAGRARSMTAAPFVRALRRLPPLETVVLVLAFGALVAVALAGDRAKRGALLDSYSTYDAASGGYRAFYELLAREGLRVDRFERRPAFLGATTDTLVWAEPLTFDPRALANSHADVTALQAWVRAGGTLLYIGSDDAAARSGILGLPRTQLARSLPGTAFIAAPLRAASVERVDARAALRYRIARRGMRVLLDDGRGAVAVTYAFGRGRVTALVDETLFTNAALARADHARLAVALANPRRTAGLVDFDESVHGYDVPEHWWQIVPRPFAIALGIAGCALALAFAGAAVRLGPPLSPPVPAERTTSDFIDALASLFARGKADRYALATAESSTARTLARAFGLPESASHDEIARRIDDDAARSAFTTLVAIAADRSRAPKSFVRGIALAQRLRKDYAAHARSRY